MLFPSCLIFAYLPSFAIFNYSLGDTQAQFLYAVQAIEWTGIEGLTWLIGLTNILAYKLLFDRENLQKKSLLLSPSRECSWSTKRVKKLELQKKKSNFENLLAQTN